MEMWMVCYYSLMNILFLYKKTDMTAMNEQYANKTRNDFKGEESIVTIDILTKPVETFANKNKNNPLELIDSKHSATL